MKIDKILNLFSLKEAEKEVFKTCFDFGGMGATEISKKVGVNRTSVYDFLDNLVESGLVYESQKDGVKKFFVQKPEYISNLIEEKQKEILEAKSIVSELKKEYYLKNNQIKPRFILYEGRKELQQMMKDMLLCRDTTVYICWPVMKIIDLLTSEFFKKFHEERIARNISIKVIWPQKQKLSFQKYPHFKIGEEYKREVRLAPENIDFSLGYAIYENTVRFISSKKENYGFLIESAEMADMMKVQFEVMWANSKSLK
jgi:sugar-specific transcriptional regulator TrmB